MAGIKQLRFPDRYEGDGGSARRNGGLGSVADATEGTWRLWVLKLGGAAVEVQHGSPRRASAVGY